MKKSKRLMLCVATFLATSQLFTATSFADDSLIPTIKEKAELTYILRVENIEWTGTLINKNYILTCAHSLENVDTTMVMIEDINGNDYLGDIIKVDFASDLALIKPKDDLEYFPNLKGRLFAKEKAYESVFTIGHPKNLPFTVSRGYVSNSKKHLDFTQMQLEIYVGSSGGAIYNSEGKIIGIVHGRLRETDMGFAVPYTDIKDFLEGIIWRRIKNQ